MKKESMRNWAVASLGLTAFLLLAIFFYAQNKRAAEPPPLAGRQSGEERGEVQVYFSPPLGESGDELRGGLDAQLAEALAGAVTSIDAALYDLNLWSVRDAFLSAHERGVAVRLVVEGENRSESVLVDLEAAGVDLVYEDRRPLMHHKFIIVDGEWVWTGSLNWTVNGVYRNNNNLLALHSEDVAADFTREFEEMFVERRFGELSREDTPFPFLVVGDAAVEVAFSPDDGAQARILRWLGGAEETVEVMAFTLTADPIAEALLDAAGRGVQVRGVIEAERFDDLGSDVRELRSQGIDFRLDSNPETMHHKVILIDNETVITGSYNFTRSAEERNDENLVILRERDLAELYREEFTGLFEAALP